MRSGQGFTPWAMWVSVYLHTGLCHICVLNVVLLRKFSLLPQSHTTGSEDRLLLVLCDVACCCVLANTAELRAKLLTLHLLPWRILQRGLACLSGLFVVQLPDTQGAWSCCVMQLLKSRLLMSSEATARVLKAAGEWCKFHFVIK